MTITPSRCLALAAALLAPGGAADILAADSAAKAVARRIVVHGHRGARAILPENTLASFEYAIRSGVDAIEFDLAVTKDNVLVVSHDQALNPAICTAPGGARFIRELTLTEVRRWDCGSLRNPQFPNQRPVPGARIPTFDEVLGLGSLGDFVFTIEPKSFPNRPQNTPPLDEFARLIVDAVKRHRLESRSLVMCSDMALLREVKRANPNLRVVPICSRFPDKLVEVARALEAPVAALNHEQATSRAVQAAHEAGIKVLCWGANDPQQWASMVEAGVDAIGNDDPAALMEFLKQRGLR